MSIGVYPAHPLAAHCHIRHGQGQVERDREPFRMSPKQNPQLPEYFQWIDAMRAVAALSVVILHYHHFYLADNLARPDIPPLSEFPYVQILWPLYYFDTWAVRLFWVISGFVFAHVYYDRITSGWSFFVARFARLYPLHFVTLIYMAGLQALSLNAVGHWQIYGNNDLRHFGMQLFLASDALKMGRGFSFNGPIWSVSVEIGSYALFFFALIFFRRLPILLPAAFCATGFFLAQSGWDIPLLSFGLFRCAGFFFSGTLLYGMYLKLDGKSGPVLALATLLAMAAIGAGYWNLEWSALVLFSMALVAILAVAEAHLPALGRKLRPLGNISYSLYLVHVPIQASILLLADLAFDGTRDFASSWWLLPVYVLTSIAVAHLAYRYFERPAGAYLRRRLKPAD